MTEFVVELYAARSDATAVALAAERARSAAEVLSREGSAVRFVRAIFMPEDETCFLLFEAATADVVRMAALRASLPVERVVASERLIDKGGMR
jgi:hypothetical protein